jgi:hypothetical protein
MCELIFMPNRINNYTGHPINIFPSVEYGTPGYDIDPSLPEPARAHERRRLLGFVGVAGFQLAVNEVTHTTPVRLPAPQPDVLGVASLDTLRAQWRVTGSIDGYAAPDDIVRDAKGHIIGAQGVAVPQAVQAPHPERLAVFTPADVAALPPVGEWQNFALHDIPLYPPDTPDVIDPKQVETILTIPKQANPNIIRRDRELDTELTDQFNVPVFRTKPSEGSELQTPEAGGVAFVQPEALRTYAAFGRAVYGLVMLGDLVRDQKGSIVGGRSITIFSRRMLADDRF